jgi:hypothetical protein
LRVEQHLASKQQILQSKLPYTVLFTGLLILLNHLLNVDQKNLTGTSSSWVCMLLQHTALFGYGIAYTITASISFGYVHPIYW